MNIEAVYYEQSEKNLEINTKEHVNRH